MYDGESQMFRGGGEGRGWEEEGELGRRRRPCDTLSMKMDKVGWGAGGGGTEDQHSEGRVSID